MRILFLSDNFPPEDNSLAMRTHGHSRYWAKWGHDVTVLTSAPNLPEGKVFPGYRDQWRKLEIIDGIKVIRGKACISKETGLGSRILKFISFMLSSFIFGLAEKKPDLIIATSPKNFSAVGGWLLAAIRRVPFIIEVRDLASTSIKAKKGTRKSTSLQLMDRLELFLFDKAKYIIALTDSLKANLVGCGFPEDKIFVIPDGVDNRSFNPCPKDPELLTRLGLSGKFIFGEFGFSGGEHGSDSVLQMADKLREDPRFHFLLVGAGAEIKNLMETAKDMGLSNIAFIPDQPKSKKPEYLSVCDMALVQITNQPEQKTVVPVEILEAMAMGIPVLLTTPEGERDASSIVKTTGSGYCISSPKTSTFFEAADHLYKSPEGLKEMGAAGRKASFKFSQELRAKEMISIFKLINKNVETMGPLKTIEKIVRFKKLEDN